MEEPKICSSTGPVFLSKLHQYTSVSQPVFFPSSTFRWITQGSLLIKSESEQLRELCKRAVPIYGGVCSLQHLYTRHLPHLPRHWLLHGPCPPPHAHRFHPASSPPAQPYTRQPLPLSSNLLRLKTEGIARSHSSRQGSERTSRGWGAERAGSWGGCGSGCDPRGGEGH